LLRRRTDLFIALAQHAIHLGADCVFIGDDAAFKGNSFISPALFNEFVIPHYREIVQALSVPVLWHSDGFIEALLPLIVDAGIIGVHALEPAAGVDMGRVKKRFGNRLVLIGNVCCSTVLTQMDLSLVRADVDRCMRQAKQGGRYILSSSNSLHAGIEVPVAVEMFRYAAEVGKYE
jgi:uroporphyrinogen decarboxylase